MSIRIMSRVWEDAPYAEGTLLVLLALADWANDDGECWPKIAQISKKARLSERQSQRCIATFLKDGTLSVIDESPGPGKPRKYQLGVTICHPKGHKGVTPEAEKGCHLEHRYKEEPSLEPSNTLVGLLPPEEGTLLGEKKDEAWMVGRVWSYYQQKVNKSLSTLTPKRESMIKKRFAEALVANKADRDAALEWMEIAIDELATSDFHNARGKNKGGMKYNDLEYVFGSPERFQKWLEESRGV